MSSPPDPLSFQERGNGAGFGGALRRGRAIGLPRLLLLASCRLSKQTVYAVLHNQAAEHRIPCLYREDVQIILLDSYV